MVWLRKFRIWLITTVTIVLITLAVIFSILRALLPHATAYVTDIEQQISALIGQPVSIESLDADMHWLTPRLKLINFVIYRNESRDVLVKFSEADFSLAIFDSIRYMTPMAGSISLHGADITIERHPENKWALQGIEFSGAETASDSDELVGVLLNMNLALLDSHVHWRDYTGNSDDMDFDDASIAIESILGRHSLRMDLSLPRNLGTSLRIIAEIDGDIRRPDTVAGSIYIDGRALALDSWVNRTRLRKYVLADGSADIELWIDVNAGSIKRLAGSAEAKKMKLSCADARTASWRADDFAGAFFWRASDDGWRVDVRELKLERDDIRWPYATNASIVRSDTGGFTIAADYLRPSDLIQLADIFVHGDHRQRFDELLSYHLQGDVFNLQAKVSADEPAQIRAVADFSDLGFSIDERRFAVQGVDGAVQLQPGQIDLQLDANTVELTLGTLFRQPLHFDGLAGAFTATRQQGQWTLTTKQAHLWNADIQTVSELRADIGDDGSVFLDMVSSFRNAQAVAARNYIPVGVLSDNLVDWMDSALLGGVISSGGFVFRGDVARFPFTENDGVVEASLTAKDANLHFLDGWPDIHHLNGNVRLFNTSLQLERASSHEDSGASSSARAEISDLSKPLLMVNGDVTASMDELQEYIRNSGLKRMLGPVLAQFQARGQAWINLELAIPLSDDAGELETKGGIRFVDNDLYFPAMNYQLTELNGILEFDGERIQGNGLSALFDGRAVAIEVADVPGQGGHETRFNLQGNWRIASLLSKYDWHYPKLMDGGSHWDVTVHVPHSAEKHPVRVEAQSDLTGVSLNLTDTISKPPRQAYAFSLELEMLGESMQLQAKVGNLLELRATRDKALHWNFVADSRIFSGKGSFRQDFATDSAIVLELDRIDLSAFRPLPDAQPSDWHLAPEDIPSLQLKTASLTWGDWTVANVSAQTEWNPRGMVLSEFSVDDAAVRISGKGSWLRRSRQQRANTDVSFTVSSANIGDLLVKLGYPRFVDGSKLSASANWNWPGEPYSFAWNSVDGSSSIALDQGVISDINPGTGGRLLGLFNMLQLPKRLSLDFRDVYRKGFVFDSVKGDYVISDGEAVTQDTEILASAADINMMGSIGLEDQDYDLVTMVRPHATGATFTGGYLAGGVIVGTGLVLLQEIFGLHLFGQDIYSIKGSWENPVVKQIAASPTRDQDEFDDDF